MLQGVIAFLIIVLAPQIYESQVHLPEPEPRSPSLAPALEKPAKLAEASHPHRR